MSKKDGLLKFEPENIDGNQFRCASEFFKRKPEMVVLNMQNEVVATIWQIGPGHYFYGPGKKKITAKSGIYLGNMTFDMQKKSITFHLCDPLQPPSHKPKRIEMNNLHEYGTALMAAYGAYQRLLKMRLAA